LKEEKEKERIACVIAQDVYAYEIVDPTS